MDDPVVSLARRKPFLRRAMRHIQDERGDSSTAYAVVTPDVAREAGFPWEADMVLACDHPGMAPVALIRCGQGSIEWV